MNLCITLGLKSDISDILACNFTPKMEQFLDQVLDISRQMWVCWNGNDKLKWTTAPILLHFDQRCLVPCDLAAD